MKHYAGVFVAGLGLLAWISALWLTYQMAQGSTSLLLIPALPLIGIAGDMMIVCGLAMLGLPLLIRRREILEARLDSFFGRKQK
jgi:hypothetical protein